MAVIYLPPNPNMVALGRGLGNIAGGFSQGLIRDQVQKIMQMPGTLEQKLPLLYRVGGPQAVQFAKQMATLQTQGLQQKALQAQTAGETAKTAYQKLLTQQAPQELALRGQQVGYQGIEAKSSELQAQAAQQNALANQARASAAVATSGAQRDELEAQAKLHEVELMKSLFQLRLMQTPGGMSNALYGNVDPLTGQPIAKPAGSIPSVPPIGVTPTGGIPSMGAVGLTPTGLAPTGLMPTGKVPTGLPSTGLPPTQTLNTSVPPVSVADILSGKITNAGNPPPKPGPTASQIDAIRLGGRLRAANFGFPKEVVAALPGNLKVLPPQTITQAAGMSSESAAMNNVVDALVHGVATGGVPVAVQQWLSERGINLSPNQTKVKDNAALAAVGRLLGARGFLNKSIIDVMSHLGPNLYKDPVNNIVSMAAFVSTELPALRAQLGAYDKNTVIRKPLEDAYQNLMSLQQRLKLLRYNPTTHRYIDIWGINNTIPASGALTPGGQEVTRQEVTQFLERSVKPITLDQAIQAASMYVDEKAAGVQSNNLRGPGAP